MSPAGDDMKRVRFIDAAADETIEIRWRRRRPGPWIPGSVDPIDDVITMRYTAPPAEVWTTKLKAEQEKKDPT